MMETRRLIDMIGTEVLQLRRVLLERPSWEEVGPESWPPAPYALYEGEFYLNGKIRHILVSLSGDDLPSGMECRLEELHGVISIEVLVGDDEPTLEEFEHTHTHTKQEHK